MSDPTSKVHLRVRLARHPPKVHHKPYLSFRPFQQTQMTRDNKNAKIVLTQTFRNEFEKEGIGAGDTTKSPGEMEGQISKAFRAEKQGLCNYTIANLTKRQNTTQGKDPTSS